MTDSRLQEAVRLLCQLHAGMNCKLNPGEWDKLRAIGDSPAEPEPKATAEGRALSPVWECKKCFLTFVTLETAHMHECRKPATVEEIRTRLNLALREDTPLTGPDCSRASEVCATEVVKMREEGLI